MDKEKFESGVQWKWMPEDSDYWMYEGSNILQYIDGELTGFSAVVDEITEEGFTITYPNEETQSHNYIDIFIFA